MFGNLNDTNTALLAGAFTIRPPTTEDIAGIVEVVNASSLDEGDLPDFTEEEALDDWQHLGFDPATDAWVAVTPDGRIAGYELVWVRDPTNFEADGYVHPEFAGRGIGTALLRRAQAWTAKRVAATAPGAAGRLRASVSRANAAARSLLLREGFTPIRHFWRMGIDLDAPPPEPAWPAGITVRTFVPGQDDHPAYVAIEEAFTDHWDHVPQTFEQWADRHLLSERFDPSLSFLAFDGGEIAGSVMAYYRAEGGWVGNLGVRRPWRQRGLGMALLLRAFGAFYRRGTHQVGLGVDALNPTGATRLYERAGMRVIARYETCEKWIEPACGEGSGADASVRVGASSYARR
ncbi:MAG TPA: GNAT family N-acetyltransferase [Ktedonobacterales bacterium]|jgi:mycothiol synthase